MTTEDVENYLLVTQTDRSYARGVTNFTITLCAPSRSIPDRMKKKFSLLINSFPSFMYSLKSGGKLSFRGLGIAEQEYAIAKFLAYIADNNKGFIPYVVMHMKKEDATNPYLLMIVKEWRQ